MKAIHAADPAPSDMVMVNIGANKGYAIVDAERHEGRACQRGSPQA
jgi:hypothetical protein